MKAALIGLGMVSGTYGDAITNSTSVDLTSVYARSADSCTDFLSKWPNLRAKAADSVDGIAGDPEVDFVILTTPPNARLEIVKKLIDAGKPILMEKPIERSLKSATDLVEACENAKVPLGIVLQHRARPVVHDLNRLVPEFGDLIAVEINVPWWRPQSYYDEPGRGTYRRDGGGVLISQAIHSIDLAIYLAGPVAQVTSMSATTRFHSMEAEDFVSAGLVFENGAFGQLFASTASFPGRGETITLHYREASAHLEAGLLRVDRHAGPSETIGATAQSGAGADPMAFTSDWHRFIIDDFADALREKRPPMVPGRSALEVHRLIAALEASSSAGKPVNVRDI